MYSLLSLVYSSIRKTVLLVVVHVDPGSGTVCNVRPEALNHLSHFLVDEKGLLSPGSTAWNAKTFCLLLAIIIMFGFLMPEDPCSKVRCVKRRAAISLRNAVKLFRCGNIAL